MGLVRLGIGSRPMKPSRSAPYAAPPAAWVVARAWPNAMADSSPCLAEGSTHARIRHSASTARTGGTGTPPSTSANQRNPAASASKKPAGAWGSVFMSAVVPLDRRSRVAVEMSPPATGAVATTAAPRSSSARRATRG